MIAWKKEGTKLYQELPGQCFETLKPCEPLHEDTHQQSIFQSDYQPFKKI
jgi:hypothetical protein